MGSKKILLDLIYEDFIQKFVQEINRPTNDLTIPIQSELSSTWLRTVTVSTITLVLSPTLVLIPFTTRYEIPQGKTGVR